MPCAYCMSETAPNLLEGELVSGGFGAFDMQRLVWLTGQHPRSGHICDDCVQRLAASQDLEICDGPDFHDHGGRISKRGLEGLFKQGAQECYNQFHRLNGARQYVPRAGGQNDFSAVEQLTSYIVDDETWDGEIAVERPEASEHALQAGRAYALSAIALGYGEADPGFTRAARHWASLRWSLDQRIEDQRDSLLWIDP